jgi:hypothetical protein
LKVSQRLVAAVVEADDEEIAKYKPLPANTAQSRFHQKKRQKKPAVAAAAVGGAVAGKSDFAVTTSKHNLSKCRKCFRRQWSLHAAERRSN